MTVFHQYIMLYKLNHNKLQAIHATSLTKLIFDTLSGNAYPITDMIIIANTYTASVYLCQKVNF